MQYEHTVDIAATPEAVWRVIADIERWPDWTPTMTSVEALDQLPLRPGLRARVKQPGLRASVLTVTAVEEGRRFQWAAKQPGLAFSADHAIEATSQGSRVRLAVEFRGRLATLVAAFYGRKIRSYVDTEAASLKVRAEAAR